MACDALAQLALAVVLTAVAGYVDAVGFLKVGRLFVSFMSGDTTQFAVASAQASAVKAGAAAGVVALFVLGVAAGRLISHLAPRRRRVAVLVVEALLLGAAAAMATKGWAVIVLMVLAMGLQNAVVHKAGDTTTSLTYVTGTLVRFGENLVDALFARKAEDRWAWAPYLALWTGLVLGAIAGAAAYAAFAVHALAAPAALLLALAFLERPPRAASAAGKRA